MNPKPHIALARPKAEKIELSAREKSAMDAATLYLPEDGTDWPKQIDVAIRMLIKKQEKSWHLFPPDNPACLAILAMESMGADYCRPLTNWYLRLIEKAWVSAFGEYCPVSAEGRLGAYNLMVEGLFEKNPRSFEVIYEREFGAPAPWINDRVKESPRD